MELARYLLVQVGCPSVVSPTGPVADMFAVSRLVPWPCWPSTRSGLRNDATDTIHRQQSPRSTFWATSCSRRRLFFWSLLSRRPAPLSGAGPARLSFGLSSPPVLVGVFWVCGSITCLPDPAHLPDASGQRPSVPVVSLVLSCPSDHPLFSAFC